MTAGRQHCTFGKVPITQGPLPTTLNGCRGGIRNYTLAVNFFEIQDPEEYLKRNAKFHKW